MSDEEHRSREYNFYFRLMHEGLTTRSAEEFRDEMEAIALNTDSAPLRQKCEKDMHRFDDVAPAVAAVR